VQFQRVENFSLFSKTKISSSKIQHYTWLELFLKMGLLLAIVESGRRNKEGKVFWKLGCSTPSLVLESVVLSRSKNWNHFWDFFLLSAFVYDLALLLLFLHFFLFVSELSVNICIPSKKITVRSEKKQEKMAQDQSKVA